MSDSLKRKSADSDRLQADSEDAHDNPQQLKRSRHAYVGESKSSEQPGDSEAAKGEAEVQEKPTKTDIVEEKDEKQKASEKEEEEEEEVECCVCLEVIDLPTKIPCGHMFCYLCIKSVQSTQAYHPRCPLCRAVIPASLLQQATLSTRAYAEKQKNSTIKYQWEYSGNQYGWWLYGDKENEEIEKHFQRYISDVRAATLAMMKPSDNDNSSATPSPLSSSPSSNSDASASSSTSSPSLSATSPSAHSSAAPSISAPVSAVPATPAPAVSLAVASALPSHPVSIPPPASSQFTLTIGHSQYVIDFLRMVQENAMYRTRRRRIQRKRKEEVVKRLQTTPQHPTAPIDPAAASGAVPFVMAPPSSSAPLPLPVPFAVPVSAFPAPYAPPAAGFRRKNSLVKGQAGVTFVRSNSDAGEADQEGKAPGDKKKGSARFEVKIRGGLPQVEYDEPEDDEDDDDYDDDEAEDEGEGEGAEGRDAGGVDGDAGDDDDDDEHGRDDSEGADESGDGPKP